MSFCLVCGRTASAGGWEEKEKRRFQALLLRYLPKESEPSFDLTSTLKSRKSLSVQSGVGGGVLEFNACGGLIEIHSATLKPPPPSHVRSMHFILHLSTWHSKPALPPKLLLLLNYNFVRSGSVQYQRQTEISLKDQTVSSPASITCTAAPSRQLISQGLFCQRPPSKDLEPDRKFPPKQFLVRSPSTSIRLS